MPRTRYRDDSDSNDHTLLTAAAAALVGLACGVLISEKFGGVAGIKKRFKGRFGAGGGIDLDALREAAGEAFADDPLDDFYDELENDEDAGRSAAELEARVLEAFTNDVVFRERAVDIGAVDGSVIELAGWVHSKAERRRAAALAREVAGVTAVVNELLVGDPDTIEAADLTGR